MTREDLQTVLRGQFDAGHRNIIEIGTRLSLNLEEMGAAMDIFEGFVAEEPAPTPATEPTEREATETDPKRTAWVEAESRPVKVEGLSKRCWNINGAPNYAATESDVIGIKSYVDGTVIGKRIKPYWHRGRRFVCLYIEGARIKVPVEVVLGAARFGRAIGHKQKVAAHRRKRRKDVP
jgi:hypothetical protein